MRIEDRLAGGFKGIRWRKGSIESVAASSSGFVMVVCVAPVRDPPELQKAWFRKLPPQP